jgi:hypothetical protein
VRAGQVDEHEREIRRALTWVSLPTAARAGRHRWRLVAPCKVRDFWIDVARTNRPYGRSTHGGAYLSHVVVGVLLVWRRGRLEGAQARWRCGGNTTGFRLLAEPDSVVCPVCTLERLARPREG